MDGEVVVEPAVRLDEAATGHEGRIIRISDRDPAVLRELAASGIGLGEMLRVVESAKEAPLLATARGQRLSVRWATAEAIWVSS